MTLRNLILIVFLALFFVCYLSYWAYQTQYREPRERLTEEIAELSQQIERGEAARDMMRQFYGQNSWLYQRSLPSAPNDARHYSFWLLELLQYSGMENNDVQSQPHSLVRSGADYRFHVQCTGTLSQFSYFLFEFYNAPFLHRITTLTLTPMEGNEEKQTFTMTINALALDSRYGQVANYLPRGWIPRLAFNNLTMYDVIGERNLLQAARGGIDRADYTALTGFIHSGDQTEVWFSVRTDDSTIKAKLGDTIRSGSFVGKIVEIHHEDIVFERSNGERWLLTRGELLNQAFALPPETAL